jgi:membrane protease YdiL (CAAX protease family)
MESEPTGKTTFHLLGLTLDVRLTVITVASTLLLTVDHYHRFLTSETPVGRLMAKGLERTAYYLISPRLIIVVLFRDRPSAYGFSLGDWRRGLKWSAVVIGLSVPVLYLASRTRAMTEYYSRIDLSILQVLATSALDLLGWEFLFRGFLLFGLLRVIGPSAVVLQAVPFALAHLGKPELETLSTIFGGILFGWVAYRSRSFWYAFLIHWFISSSVQLMALHWAR